ncbi:C1 family peptidase [Candidatus Chloroploca sp. Khr17]|uniref:C1 family peptidase n=1 Tax=Candidatus Chloroploca sp. Khr17 TaxID=2496869 RepID=UPI00101B66E1|nr:C1 family peptidase [Candidatus Chloroploca sp. Khr17]
MHSNELTPLATIPAFSREILRTLADYWITTAEEFIATARMRNPVYETGLGALGAVLNTDQRTVQKLVEAAVHASPAAADFGNPLEHDTEFPGGLIFDSEFDEGLDFSRTPPTFDAPSLPAACSLTHRFPVVGNQGQRLTCVAFALIAMYQCMSGDPTDLSEQYLFWLCKEHDGAKHDAQGTRASVGAAMMQQFGVCLESFWPYQMNPSADRHNIGQGPPDNEPVLQDDAQKRRITTYHVLEHPRDVATLKSHLASDCPVLIGLTYQMHWSKSRQVTRLGRLRPPLPGEHDVGGHAMCLVGYCDDETVPGGGYFIVRNSWGIEWASENSDGAGYAHLPYAVLTAQNRIVALVLKGATSQARRLEERDTEMDERYQQALAAGLNLPVAVQARLIAALAANVATGIDATGRTKPLLPSGDTATPPIPVTSTWFDAIEREENPLAWMIPNGIDPTIGRARYRFDLAGARSTAATNAWDKHDMERKLHERREGHGKPTLGLIHGFDYGELAIAKKGAGWGLVACAQDSAQLLIALWPLLKLRCEQQGYALPPEPRQDETCGAWLRRVVGDAYVDSPLKAPSPVPVFLFDASRGENGEAYNQWVARHGIGADAGAVDPRRGLPFYLLLAGRPGPRYTGDPHIPFRLQYDLDLFWGVGRLTFTDLLGEHRYSAYTAYAEAVVRAETGAMTQRARELVYFGPRHNLDRATALSTTELIAPLLDGNDGQVPLATRFGFTTRTYLETNAHRTALERLFQGQDHQPAVVFSASHGIDLPIGHPDLIAQQGALLCSDWDGFGSPRRDHWFTGDDLSGDARVEGLIAVVFACFGLGCPPIDSFRIRRDGPPTALAPHAFVAQLPQRILERGGLAVIGHVDRAWSYSFRDEMLKVPRQAQAFEDLLSRILDGKRLGEATDQFNMRQGMTAVHLTELLDKYRHAQGNLEFEIQRIGPRWAAFSDARAYALLGDPAVRIVTSPAQTEEETG